MSPSKELAPVSMVDSLGIPTFTIFDPGAMIPWPTGLYPLTKFFASSLFFSTWAQSL
eukprot:CAMPEP_0182512208 /NCGR_PEP_ID=MMETSP1321-20130603/31799_1 /TAXON_ID=91990 /ORGANISM="Bolidomonas sp., Strain RCC1657" /LENGTH=56 /DNA_ID=CAMNT_0024718975 /DNA_START=120 /DNA_END=287 /DNA_ORIENTATION=+